MSTQTTPAAAHLLLRDGRLAHDITTPTEEYPLGSPCLVHERVHGIGRGVGWSVCVPMTEAEIVATSIEKWRASTWMDPVIGDLLDALLTRHEADEEVAGWPEAVALATQHLGGGER